MTSTSTLTRTDPGCGQADHSASCLCDVIIKEPVPVRFDMKEIWHAKAIARAVDYTGADDSPERWAVFAEKMMEAYEATASARGMRTSYESNNEVRFLALELLQARHSILDLPDLLEESLGERWELPTIVQLLTLNAVSEIWKWSELDWLYAESLILDPDIDLSATDFARKLGLIAEETKAGKELGRSRLSTLCEWYGTSMHRSKKKGNRFDVEARERREFIAARLDMDLTDLYEAVKGELGHTSCSNAAIRNQRSKLLKKRDASPTG